MQLWEHGKLRLDDDVDDYLPFTVRHPLYPGVPVTFRMLLTHTSGLTSGEYASLQVIEFGRDSPIALGEFLEEYFVPDGEFYAPELSRTASRPGTDFEYSNIGYCLLGYLVEVIAGTPFDRYCTRNIFAPLGMNRTAFRLAELFAAGIDPAMPYVWSQATQSHVAFGHNASADYPNGGLRSSANDLARFLLAHMNGGAFGGARILAPETVALMHTKYAEAPPGDGYTWGYGFGFEVTRRSPQQRQPDVGHSGLWLGAATAMYFRPEGGVGVIVLANAAGGILNPPGVQEIRGREFCAYSFIPQRLLDEATAAP